MGSPGRFPDAFFGVGSASFTDFVASYAPGLLPGGREVPAGGAGELPHGTTIVAIIYDGGVILAGDRRATAGNVIAQKDIEKVFRADEYSGIAIAGTAGIGIEVAQLFQVELEHYEKTQGRILSLEGKANRLSNMIRGNLALAMQGLVVVPLFAGYDLDREVGRIYSYDPTGARYEEHQFHSIGSGSPYARGALKKLYRSGMSADDAVLACVQALYDAADDDSATGGPDLTRQIFPLVAVIDDEGYRRLPDEQVGALAREVIDGRMGSPGGPNAPLR